LTGVVGEAFAALAEDVAAEQRQSLGQLGVFFLQLAIFRRGLIEHAFELTDAALCVFNLLLSDFGSLLGALGLLPQLRVAAEQVLEQPLAFVWIVRDVWRDAHDTSYTRSFMLFQSTSADFIRFFSSAGALESFALTCTAQVDPREEHGQLRRLEFDTVLVNGIGQLERARFESFVPDRQPISIKVEDLDPIPAAVEEQEEMAGQGVLPKALLDQSAETIEAFA
jgi:hypothetical protein